MTPDAPHGMGLDQGDDDDDVRATLEAVGLTAHRQARGEAATALTAEAGNRAHRWVVERSHRWMHRLRRILVRGDKQPDNYLALLHVACALIAFRAAGLFG